MCILGRQLLTTSSSMYTLMNFGCGWREIVREKGCTFAKVFLNNPGIFSSELEWGRNLGPQGYLQEENSKQECVL